MSLNYVLDESGLIKADDKGLPLVIDTSKENDEPFGLDAIGLYSKIPALQKEAKDRRLELNKVKQQLEKYESLGVDDLDSFPEWKDKASKALELIKNLDDKKLIEADEVEKLKNKVREESTLEFSKIKKQYEQALKEKEEALGATSTQIRELLVDNQFHSSKYIPDVLTLTPRMAKKVFGDNFKVETVNNQTMAVGYIGNEPIMSKSNIGEYASFDEALKIMIDADPDKDSYTKVDVKKVADNNTVKPTLHTFSVGQETLSSIDKIKAGLAQFGLND
jgi:uncharacterized protein YdaT